MKSIRLKQTFKFDHCEISAGTVIAVPAEKAFELIQRGVADMIGPEHAVVEPQETRVYRPKRKL
jgi:hypothetical protein